METDSNPSKTANVDSWLIFNARLGVEDAFTQILSRYKKAIYLMISKIVNNKVVAEDLTIEAFEKAFTKIHLYENQFSFSSWLFTIATNNTIDYLRRKRYTDEPLDSVKLSVIEIGPQNSINLMARELNPEEAFIKQQNAGILHQAMSALQPKYRIVLEMRYFREYTYSEICKELNLPLGTVKARLFRSREKLFELLKDSGIDNRIQNQIVN